MKCTSAVTSLMLHLILSLLSFLVETWSSSWSQRESSWASNPEGYLLFFLLCPRHCSLAFFFSLLFVVLLFPILRNCLAMWLRPPFMLFHATSCLVNNKRVLLFVGSHMLLRLKCMKRGSNYELLPARPKSNSCYCSVNSGACLHCSPNIFF